MVECGGGGREGGATSKSGIGRSSSLPKHIRCSTCPKSSSGRSTLRSSGSVSAEEG
jgi:hypothetical protein